MGAGELKTDEKKVWVKESLFFTRIFFLSVLTFPVPSNCLWVSEDGFSMDLNFSHSNKKCRMVHQGEMFSRHTNQEQGYMWLKYLPLIMKSNESVNKTSMNYINSFPEAVFLLACTKNQYLWGKLKDHLAFSSHSGYSVPV